jgi:hypothetical protein
VVAEMLMKTLAKTLLLSPSKTKSRWQTGEKSAAFFFNKRALWQRKQKQRQVGSDYKT